MTIGPFSTATEMLTALRQRAVSAVELLELHLARIERHNRALIAIVVPTYDRARQAAQAADNRRARGEDGPLLGLPVTVKESMLWRGTPSTIGLSERAEHRSDDDGILVTRLLDAGAVMLGKTNIPPWLADWQADNPVYGRTNNPWDLERSPGGSTGGGAAALAAGLTPLETGSDIGGSVRVPPAFCGVYGHRPSETALPKSGEFPGTLLPNMAEVLAVPGPLARSADDLELSFDVLAGPDVGEATGWWLAIPAARHERLAEFRVAVLPPIPWLTVDDELLAAQEAIVAALTRAGATVAEAQPESFGDLTDFYRLYLSLLFGMLTIGLPPDEREEVARSFMPDDYPFGEAMLAGVRASLSDYILLHGRRETYRADLRAFFGSWDILLCPTTIGPAFRHYGYETPLGQRTVTINGRETPYTNHVVYPSIATLPGHPATAFPAGLSRAGLPLGLQAIGPYLEDRTPLRFASLLAREIGGFVTPPGFEP